MKSVLQDWVMCMGLRQQGSLLSAIRGCDTVPKYHITKQLVRAIRADALNGFSSNPKTFIVYCDYSELIDIIPHFLDGMDELPSHYLSHLMHGIEILAFYHPKQERRDIWHMYYLRICKRWHVNPETKEQLEIRLNAPEDIFATQEDEL